MSVVQRPMLHCDDCAREVPCPDSLIEHYPEDWRRTYVEVVSHGKLPYDRCPACTEHFDRSMGLPGR